MKIEADYIRTFEDEQRELEAIEPEKEALTEKEARNLELLIKLIDAEHSQYRRAKNESRRNLWEKMIYPAICQIAQIQGGRVTFEVDEDSLVGKLTYLGHDLIINDVSCSNLKCFKLMLANTEDLFISAKDGLTELLFVFHLFDKEKIGDNTEEIRILKEKIFSKSCIDRMLNDN